MMANSHNNVTFDEISINNALESMNNLLQFLKSISASDVPNEIKTTLFNIYEKCGYLITFWEIYDKKGYFEYKIDDSLWGDNLLFKYLFEDYITVLLNSRSGKYDLFCTLCDIGFDCKKDVLMNHLGNENHYLRFESHTTNMNNIIWKNLGFYKHAFKKFIELRNNKTLYCKLCGVVMPYVHVNLVGHLNGKEHWKNFKAIIDFKFINNNNIANGNKFQTLNNKPVNNPLITVGNNSTLQSGSNDILQDVRSEVSSWSSISDFSENNSNKISKDIIKHRLFLSYCKKAQSNCRKIFCQLCCAFYISPEESILKHETSDFHKKNCSEVGKIGGTLEWRQCLKCFTDFFCTNEFILFHLQENCQSSFKITSNNNPSIHFYEKRNSKKNSSSSKLKKAKAESFTSNKTTQHSNEKITQKYTCKNNLSSKVTQQNPCPSSEKEISDLSSNYDKSYATRKEVLDKCLSVLIDKFSQKAVDSNIDCYGFYCELCNFWSEKNWSNHLILEEHAQNVNDHFKIFDCNCCVKFFCSNTFYNHHLNSYEHNYLKVLFSKENKNKKENKKYDTGTSVKGLNKNKKPVQKNTQVITQSSSSSVNVDKSKLTSEKDVKKVLSADESMNSLKTSPVQMDLKPEKLNDVQQGNYNYVKKNIDVNKKSHRWFGITGLSWDIDENDIRCAVEDCIGVVEIVDILDPELANVYVKLRENFKEDETKSIYIKGESFYLKEPVVSSFKVQDKDIIQLFVKNRENFFRELFVKAEKESNNSITVFDESFLKTELVKDDLLKHIRNLKQVICIGSRAVGLAQSNSSLDLYIEIGDCYFKNVFDNKEMSRQLSRIAAELKSSRGNNVIFCDVKVYDSNIEAVHCLTEMKLKIFIGNGLIVEKNNLIRLIVNSDVRVKQLILIIKEWTKYICPLSTSSYTLTWIVLYYLIKVSVVKPVHVLKSVIREKKLISGWECGFDGNLIKPNSNLMTLDELLKGFFEFYGDENSTIVVFCIVSLYNIQCQDEFKPHRKSELFTKI
ncbi:uncharacterized protein LOC142331777 isoform X2 [Lycorma delicatula]|uniref:uncharacterized protein LOC142331777 isoform X2 n=1 Tax=Lycorma delicatula TaxID=130591 RepID=UPI003F51A305